MKRRLLALTALLLVVPACASDEGSSAEPEPDGVATTTAPTASEEEGEEATVFPGEEWTVADPADHGIDPAGLEAARAYAFEPQHSTQGVVVVHRGEIVAEWYADGADQDSWVASWSVAKSFTSAAVGIAIEECDIGSVDDTAATYLEDWVGTEHESITLKDLLQMNSGIDFVEDYRDPGAEIAQMVTGEPDQLAYAMSIPQGVEPGTRWNYSSGDTMILAGVLEAATGEPLHEHISEVLFEPIGIDQAEWWRDAENNTLGYCCLDSTSRNFARLGLLYLNEGRWDGEQVVPEQWVADSIDPVENSDGQYGYQWWTYDIEGTPEELFLAEGIDGQFIYVIPSLDLVVVRNGTYVKDPGPPVADPNLFPVYPSGSLVPGRGTSEPVGWDSSQFLVPIIEAVGG